MVNVDTNFDTIEVDRALADVELRGRRLRPAFRELRKPLRLDQVEHARGEEGPSSKWPPRSPLTEARRLARNRGVRITRAMRTIAPRKITLRSTPKRILGRLPSAVVYTVGDLFVRATSRASFGGAHQFGGNVGRGRRIKLPVRTFLWLSDKIVEHARDVLGDYVMKGWKE